MPSINVYLNFNGNCEEAFNLYRSVFGGEFGYVGRFKDMPADAGHQMPAEDSNLIMHISLPISKETVLMGSDVGSQWAPQFQAGNNFSISIDADSKESADNIFKGLSSGGQVKMPPAKTFWSEYFGMWTDKFGVNWMISYNEKPQQK